MERKYKKLIKEAEKLPSGKELGYMKYYFMLHCIDKLEKTFFWQKDRKRFYKKVLEKAIN